MLILIRIYQKFLSPLLPPCCRFYPCCSEYMLQSVGKRGVVVGGILGTRRIFRCHPWNPGGFDPVP